MNDFPWLTVIGVIPLVGAAVVAGLPAGLADRAKHVALGFSLVTLVFGIAAALQFENKSGRSSSSPSSTSGSRSSGSPTRSASTASRW